MLLRGQDEDFLEDIVITTSDSDADLAQKIPRSLMGYAVCARDILRAIKIVQNDAYALYPHGPPPCDPMIRIRGAASSPDQSVAGLFGEE